MNAIRNVFAAFPNLAASLNALAGVIDSASAKLRLQLATETEPPALTPCGEVIDGNAEAESNAMPSAKRNGCKTAAT